VVIEMKQADLDKISEIVARYGFVEWSLVGFTPAGDYEIFSYFTDPSVLRVFKVILYSMLKTLEGYLEEYEGDYQVAVPYEGAC
jgi:hypothetical protein